jgi:hypothetical protein
VGGWMLVFFCFLFLFLFFFFNKPCLSVSVGGVQAHVCGEGFQNESISTLALSARPNHSTLINQPTITHTAEARWEPPSTTSDGKRVVWIGGRPYFVSPGLAAEQQAEPPAPPPGPAAAEAQAPASQRRKAAEEEARARKAMEEEAVRRQREALMAEERERRERKQARREAQRQARRERVLAAQQQRLQRQQQQQQQHREAEAAVPSFLELMRAAREGRVEDLKGMVGVARRRVGPPAAVAGAAAAAGAQQGQASSSLPAWAQMLRQRDGRRSTLLHACVSTYRRGRRPRRRPGAPLALVEEGRLAVAEWLLALDAELGFALWDMAKDRDDQGRAVVHAAAEACDADMLALLLRHRERHGNRGFKLDLNGA